MAVRRMTIKDKDAILALDKRLFLKEESQWEDDNFGLNFNLKYSFVSYDETTNEINGYVFARPTSESNIIIGKLGVPPEQQQNIGAILMNAVFNAAHDDPNITAFRLHVESDNPAIPLYQRLGFRDVPHRELDHRVMKRSAVSTRLTAPERVDITAVENEIARLRRSSRSFFSRRCKVKADKIQAALTEARRKDSDVRDDAGVQEALLWHRKWSFFSRKTTKAKENVDKSRKFTLTSSQ